MKNLFDDEIINIQGKVVNTLPNFEIYSKIILFIFNMIKSWL